MLLQQPQHQLCPKGKDSWCGNQRDSKTYQHKNGIPKPIVELVEPIFDDLVDPASLSKCTHGLTQNPNECLNGTSSGTDVQRIHMWNRKLGSGNLLSSPEV